MSPSQLPIHSSDVWAKATEEHKLHVLRALAKAMPKRYEDDGQIELATYMAALDGVTAYALNQAFKSASQGKHGTVFMPSPAELRILCDRAQAPLIERLNELKRQERIRQERPGAAPERTPEERERQAERMRKFHEAMAAAPLPSFPAEPPRRSPLAEKLIAEGMAKSQGTQPVNPPDLKEGEPIKITPALERLLRQQAEDDKALGELRDREAS